MQKEPEHARLVKECLAEGHFLGAELILGDAYGERLHETYGYARKFPMVPWAQGALVDVASVTKAAATSLALALCVQEGLVDLEAPVGRYLDGMGEGRDRRLRDLASHVSGFDNRKHFLAAFGRDHKDLARAVLDEPPARPAGEKYEYACANLILVGLVVEAVTKLRLADYCRRRVYQPLGMHDTRFGPITDDGLRVVKMLNVEPGLISDEPARSAVRPIGNAGLYTTAPDLGRLCRMLLNGGKLAGAHVFTEETVTLFEKNLNPPGLHPRSLGWDLGDAHRPEGFSERTFGHTGWTGQSLYIDRGTGCFAVLLTNRHGDHEQAMALRAKIVGAARAFLG